MIAALAALLLQSAPAALPPLHHGFVEIHCPVGGERFSAPTTPVYSTMGRRPDEQPYSDVTFPLPMPECPGNGLTLFAHFTPAETAQLAKWIATPTYQAMRATESPFYRAYWLAKKIGRPDADAIELLLPAIWSAKQQDRDDPRRPHATRYQRVLVAAVVAASPAVSVDDRVWLQSQAANALREMGDFAAAERMRARAEQALPQTTRPPLAIYLQKLKAVIARRDRGDEPLDMIPDWKADSICRDHPPRDRFARDYCASPALAKINGS
ncbi:hypothetical protein [Sphingomonas melonis]|uniref:Uncharacterized protein n=1 Tax=Sphingomonas melonis TaxID=152682 RepID=A0A7Y9FPY8_9SPHN|nr:hypothetical protein [Sphingomonas melonis]NYD91284.1 hypothetical protein [Sphingomonas melonis]